MTASLTTFRRDDARALAREARLRYVTDALPGIRRRRRGRGFQYLDPEGKPIRDAETRQRIEALAIPPAWEDVWICPLAHGHLQATGRDEAGRKQYRYHPRWEQVRSEAKYGRLRAFGELLPRLRRRVDADLQRPGLERQRVLAVVVRLLDTTLIRVGNDEYAEAHGSYGLTTMRGRHVDVEAPHRIRFTFTGKSGQHHEIDCESPRPARIVPQCQDLPGQELFAYLDEDDQPVDVTSGDVNDYLRQVADEDFTAKVFRTWGGTVLAAITLTRLGWVERETKRRRRIVQAVKTVAETLGNTPATCRKYYIHPAVLDAYERNHLADVMNPTPREDRPVPRRGLSVEEESVLDLLRQRGSR